MYTVVAEQYFYVKKYCHGRIFYFVLRKKYNSVKRSNLRNVYLLSSPNSGALSNRFLFVLEVSFGAKA